MWEEEHEAGLHAAAQPDGGEDAQANPPHNIPGPGLHTVMAYVQSRPLASRANADLHRSAQLRMHVGAPCDPHAPCAMCAWVT